jgi:hypothetical protein
MPKRLISSVLVIVASLMTALTAFGSKNVFAAADCLAQPGRDAGPGAHWYYHFDRGNNRKCWYPLQPQPATPQPAPDASTPPAVPSFFSTFFGNLPRPNPPESQQGLPASTGYVTQDETKNGDPSTDPRMVPQPDTIGSVSLKRHRQTPPRPRPQEADRQPVRPLTQAQRDVLFQEYLQWRERQP